MDISSIFTSCVRDINSCSKAMEICHELPVIQRYEQKRNFLFSIKIQVITNQMKKLHLLLLEYHKEYLTLYDYLSSKPKNTNVHWKEFEFLAENIISTCLNLIQALKKEIKLSEITTQYQEHQEIVIFLIENHLKQISKVYYEHKAARVKKVLELKEISKLESSLKNINCCTNHKFQFSGTSNLNKINHIRTTPLKNQLINEDIAGLLQPENEFQSSEDIQLFEAENDILFTELSALTEEIRHIESQVVQITELQDSFTEKVLYQDRNLEHVLTLVLGSTENVVQANEHIRNAIQRNAGLRVWFLFFLLVMSFTLIFLDWYNP